MASARDLASPLMYPLTPSQHADGASNEVTLAVAVLMVILRSERIAFVHRALLPTSGASIDARVRDFRARFVLIVPMILVLRLSQMGVIDIPGHSSILSAILRG